MHTQRLDWGVLVAEIYAQADSRDRMRAQWDACKEVLENDQAYRPLECLARPPALDRVQQDEIVIHAVRAVEEGNPASRNVMRAFCTWRAHVTEIESLNAGRLFVLASTLRTLVDLHSKASQPEIILARISRLGAFIERAWGVQIPPIGDLRMWSQKVVRRYDLLPAQWREL